MSTNITLNLPGALVRAAGLALALTASLQASAVTVQLGSRAALAGTDSVSWGQLGADFDEVTPLAAPFTTANAAAGTVNNLGGPLYRADEGGLNSGLASTFALGDALIGTIDNAGPIIISFASPFARVGLQITSGENGAFTATMEAFNSLSASLGLVQVNGMASFDQDNSAPFIGIGSSGLDIASVRLSVTGTGPNNYLWVNQMDLSVVAVPEPQGYALAALSLLGLLAVRRARSR